MNNNPCLQNILKKSGKNTRYPGKTTLFRQKTKPTCSTNFITLFADWFSWFDRFSQGSRRCEQSVVLMRLWAKNLCVMNSPVSAKIASGFFLQGPNFLSRAEFSSDQKDVHNKKHTQIFVKRFHKIWTNCALPNKYWPRCNPKNFTPLFASSRFVQSKIPMLRCVL